MGKLGSMRLPVFCNITYLETHEKGKGHGNHNQTPREHGEYPAAKANAMVRFVG